MRSERSGWWHTTVFHRARCLTRARHRSPGCCFRQHARRSTTYLGIMEKYEKRISYTIAMFAIEDLWSSSDTSLFSFKSPANTRSFVQKSTVRPRSCHQIKAQTSFRSHSYLHLRGDEVRNVTTILLLRVSHQRQRAIVHLDYVFPTILSDQQLDRADIQSTEQLGHVIDPGAMSFAHG